MGFGALLGGALSLGSSLFGGRSKGGGSSGKPKSYSRLDSTQQGIQRDLAEGINGRGTFAKNFNFDPEEFRRMFQQTIAQPQYQSFQENAVPTITGAFRGQGLGQSSYLGNALSKAGSDLQGGLNAQLAQYSYQGNQDAMERRLRAAQGLLNNQTQGFYTPQARQQGGSNFDQLLNTAGTHGLNYLLQRYLPTIGR